MKRNHSGGPREQVLRMNVLETYNKLHREDEQAEPSSSASATPKPAHQRYPRTRALQATLPRIHHHPSGIVRNKARLFLHLQYRGPPSVANSTSTGPAFSNTGVALMGSPLLSGFFGSGRMTRLGACLAAWAFLLRTW
jgi:hypothetical protein